MRSEGVTVRMLRSGRAKFAARAAERLCAHHPDPLAHPATESKSLTSPGAATTPFGSLDRCLAALEEAVRVGSPEPFLEALHTAIGSERVGAHLDALSQVLEEDLPSAAFVELEPVLLAARGEVVSSTDADASFLDVDSPLGSLAAEFLGLVLEGDRRRASQRLLRSIDQGTSAKELMLQVLMPVQAEVGRLWHKGELSPAEEHLVTHTTDLVLGQLYDRLPRDPSNGKVVVAGAVSGDLHSVGVRVTTDFFEMDGWRGVFLGPDVSAEDFVRGANEFEADLVLIGATLSGQRPRVKETIALLHQACLPRVPVLVGGQAFRGGEQAWRSTGAEACAGHPEEAVRIGRGLVGLTG